MEMFSMLGSDLVQIVMVAQTKDPVPSGIVQNLTEGPRSSVDCTFNSADQFDVLLVPGGFGTLPQLENEAVMAFLRRQICCSGLLT